VPRPDPLARMAAAVAHRLASRTTRRSFLATVGASAAGLALAGSGDGVTAGRRRPLPGTEPAAGWFGFCGHYFTTGSCPSPHHLPRVDQQGYPVRPADGLPVDDLGRLVSADGLPVDESGGPLLGPDGALLPRAPRTRVCEDWVPERYGVDAVSQGSWYRCCDGEIRKLWDCCSTSRRRINGDEPLRGYCDEHRGVFCVVYVDTGVPC
jgi:hypothetical protein